MIHQTQYSQGQRAQAWRDSWGNWLSSPASLHHSLPPSTSRVFSVSERTGVLSIMALSGASCSPAQEASTALVRAGAESPHKVGTLLPGGSVTQAARRQQDTSPRPAAA